MSRSGRKIRCLLAAAALFGLYSLRAGAQTLGEANHAGAAGPEFGVATVKVNDTGSHSSRLSITDDLLRATNIELDSLIQAAFDIHREQIIGLPHWAQVSRYDMVAKVVDMNAEQLRGLSGEQRRAMLRQLLEQRFQLRVHIESRTLPLLRLVVDKGGIKFTEWQKGADDSDDKKGSMHVNNEVLTAIGVPMESLVRVIASETHMPVVDETGLKGNYNLHMKWEREEQGSDSGLHDQPLPTIYAALPEQLGLKLEAGKGPVDVLVVDHIEQPTEN